MDINTWFAFILASIATLIVPGPNSLLALTHGAIHGYKKTPYTILGGSLGFVLLIALCIFGIAAIIQASQLAFLRIKIFGGLYLIWLGIKTWRAAPINVSVNNLTIASSPLILFL
ncbi:LysE family translocator [Acinetobacter sp. ANC 5383]